MSKFDYAIVGSDQASALLAGVLAQSHQKKVLLIQDLAAPYRLPRDYYLSFPMATRPGTFQIAASQTAEARALLTKIAGRQVLLNVSPICCAYSRTASVPLAHMMHMTKYFGIEMDRIEGGANEAHSAYRIRGAQWVRPRLLWPALAKYVINSGVTVVDSGMTQIVTHRDGSARVEAGESRFDTEHLVLADGSALLKFGHKGDVRQNFVREWGTALLTEPAEMRDKVVLHPGGGFCAWQQANGTIGIVARGPADHVGEQVRANLNTSSALRRAGQAEFVQMVPKDGAPVIGRFSRSGVLVAAGFGQTALYLAPAIARYLTGGATVAERSYFGAREPSAARDAVADFEFNPLGAGEKP